MNKKTNTKKKPVVNKPKPTPAPVKPQGGGPYGYYSDPNYNPFPSSLD